MSLGLVQELERLNARYEIAKMDPEWDEQRLQILITAQGDLAKLIDNPTPEVDWHQLPGKDL